MKCFPFLEIWVQRQRYHPSLVRAQCANFCHTKAKYMVSTSVREFFLIPLSCVTPSDSITLRVDILPPQNQPVIRIAGFLKLGKQHVKPRMCLMLSRSPSGVESQAELLYAERIICHPLEAAPDSGVRARSLRPAVLPLTGLWLQLCV